MVSENVLSVGKYTETAIHLIHVLKIKKQFMQVICDHKLLTFIKKLKKIKKQKTKQNKNPKGQILSLILYMTVSFL